MEYVLIGLGGAFGSLTRYILGNLISKEIKSEYPLGTWIINITGAFLLGWVSSMGISKAHYSFFGIGFLGAYTTFSTFMQEDFFLWAGKQRRMAALYLLLSVGLGVLGYILGFQMGK